MQDFIVLQQIVFGDTIQLIDNDEFIFITSNRFKKAAHKDE